VIRLSATIQYDLTSVELHDSIGEFPTKGVILHHHLAKLYLHSHVFRGRKGADVPQHFQNSAVAAVIAASSIIETVLTDDDIREALVGIPHYIHSMIAFACVFLLKIAAQYSGQYIEDSVVFDLTTRAVEQFRSTPVGKWHLVHLMAEGLDKMLAKKTQTPLTTSIPQNIAPSSNACLPQAFSPLTQDIGGDNFFEDNVNGASLEDTFNYSASSFLNFDTGMLDLDFTGFGF
jgi:hypothetical protein